VECFREEHARPLALSYGIAENIRNAGGREPTPRDRALDFIVVRWELPPPGGKEAAFHPMAATSGTNWA
jgi:hypothetical protein